MLNWYFTDLIARVGEERYDFLTTHPEDRHNAEGEKRWHPVSMAIINNLMACGISHISEANAYTVARRIATRESQSGASLCYVEPQGFPSTGPIGIYLTMEDVVEHIGLTTNVTSASNEEFKRKFGTLELPRFGTTAHSVVEERHRLFGKKARDAE